MELIFVRIVKSIFWVLKEGDRYCKFLHGLDLSGPYIAVCSALL